MLEPFQTIEGPLRLITTYRNHLGFHRSRDLVGNFRWWRRLSLGDLWFGAFFLGNPLTLTVEARLHHLEPGCSVACNTSCDDFVKIVRQRVLELRGQLCGHRTDILARDGSFSISDSLLRRLFSVGGRLALFGGFLLGRRDVGAIAFVYLIFRSASRTALCEILPECCKVGITTEATKTRRW